MAQRDDIAHLDLAALRILHYPDPRLQQPAKTVQTVDAALGALVERMFELMAAARGVGLAAPQVGLPLRVFVACPTGEPADRRAYVNPTLLERDGQMEEEEGCLSVPGVTSHIKRFSRVTLGATDLAGQRFQQSGQGLLARIFQHETDHLDGRLIVDRMGSLARLAHRRALRDLRKQFDENR
ncbi:MAG: peptide deformylase [Phycisphaerae bacterium]|nr:peptide deformylase [Phycisphaerae bacterium]